MVKNRSDRLLTRGVTSGDVEELLGGPRTFLPQLVNQGLIGSPEPECADYVGIGDVGQLIVLPRKTSDVVTEGLIRLLLTVLEAPRVSRARVGALKVPHEDLLQVRPTFDGVGREVVQPCPGRVGQEQREVGDDEVVIIHAAGLRGKLVVLNAIG
jgi:hypothetical protein